MQGLSCVYQTHDRRHLRYICIKHICRMCLVPCTAAFCTHRCSQRMALPIKHFLLPDPLRCWYRPGAGWSPVKNPAVSWRHRRFVSSPHPISPINPQQKSAPPLHSRNETLFFHVQSYNQPSEIASVGHAAAQVPQSTHSSALITYFPSPSLIAPTGHSPSQVPQLTQSSEITYAIVVTSLLFSQGLIVPIWL